MKKFVAAALSAAISIGAVSAANVCAVTLDIGGISADMSVVSASGKCGTNVEWKYENGKLTITGYGDMKNYEMAQDAPWNGFKRELSAVEIDDRITKIGNCAFADLPKLAAVKIPDGVREIGRGAFDSCTSIVSIDVPAACAKIGMGAFCNCASLQKITIRNSSCQIFDDKETISNCSEISNVYYNGVVECASGSTAESFAKRYGYKTAPIGSSPDPVTETTTTTTTTTTTSTTTTTTVTTTQSVTTTSVPQPKGSLGDIDNNGAINAVDASCILVEYANVSTGKAPTLSSDIADVDKNGVINAVDASCILSYYAYTSTATGEKKSLEDFVKQ